MKNKLQTAAVIVIITAFLGILVLEAIQARQSYKVETIQQILDRQEQLID